MKKSGILNAQLIGCIAALGHKDLFMIGDAGMPIPKGVPIVDLVLCGGVPTFRQVMDAILEETVVEGYTIADEIQEKNPELLAYIQEKLAGAEEERIPHTEIKSHVRPCKICGADGRIHPLSQYYPESRRSVSGINLRTYF